MNPLTPEELEQGKLVTNYTICACMNYGHDASNILKCKWRGVHVVDENHLRFLTMPGESPSVYMAVFVAIFLMPTVTEIDVYDGKYIQRRWKRNGEEWVSMPVGDDLEGPK